MLDLYNPDTLGNLCHQNSLWPSKKYGQNYLIDPLVIDTILDAAELKEMDVIVEVGPGFGVLTQALAPRVNRVITFEIEKKLEAYWAKRLVSLPNVEVIWGNALRQTDYFPNLGAFKVVANIPYQITSPLIRLFLELAHPPQSLTLMVQKEVAERICAQPGDLSVLGLSVQYYADVRYVATVNRSAFWPSPAVDSAIIHLTPRQVTATASETAGLFELIKIGFSNRRKFLSKNILPFIGKDKKAKLSETFERLSLLPTVRAQELSLQQWKTLFQEFATKNDISH